MKKFLYYIIRLLEKIINKKILFINKNSKSLDLQNSAVKSKFGFWYVGNVFDSSDIAYGIANNGLVEKDETELVQKILNKLILEKNITFYDIGANTGYYGILAAFLDKQKIKTYSFEPLIEYVNCINESALLNHLDNIKVFNFALGNENKSKQIQLAGSGSSLDTNFLDNPNLQTREIQVRKLDDLILENNLSLPDFIKIDVEGYEYEVLQGCLETIKKSQPILFIEIAYSLKSLRRKFVNIKFEDTFNLLTSLGYKPYYLNNANLIQFSTKNKPDGVNMYLFLHKKTNFLF